MLSYGNFHVDSYDDNHDSYDNDDYSYDDVYDDDDDDYDIDYLDLFLIPYRSVIVYITNYY
jgi:hypothetical protein